MNSKINVACVTCKKQFSYYDSPFRPFCSERCKMIDLGHWFDESYKVKGPENLTEDLEDEFLDTMEDENDDQ